MNFQPTTSKYLLVLFLSSFCYGSTDSFYGRKFHTSIIAGDWIYIEGGLIANSTSGGTYPDWKPSNSSYGLDLSKDWTNSTLEMILTKTFSDSNDSPLSSHRIFWGHDNNRNIIYCFAGNRHLGLPYEGTGLLYNGSIWGFRPDGEGSGNWNQVLGPFSTPFPRKLYPIGGGSSASDKSSGYYLGGGTEGFQDPGLLTFNFDTLTVTNSSDDGYSEPEAIGAIINIPIYGDDGVRVILPSTLDSPNYGFGNITLYDKKNKKWYWQFASGEIPRPRAKFCAVGMQGDENPYFEIFIYGGIIGQETSATADDGVYVLSLPSFRWFNATYTSILPRSEHTCHATNSSQMIIVGGEDPSNDFDRRVDDPWPQGIGVFDMTALNFKDSYQAKARAYETPDIIKKYHSIDGNKYPAPWMSAAVKDLFEGKSNKPSNTPNLTTSNPTVPPNSPSSSISKSRSRLSHGVLAIIVDSCTAAFILSAIGVALMVKRWSRSTKSIDPPNELDSTSPFNPPLGELPAERRPEEILTSNQDRAELPGAGRRPPVEMSTGELNIPEIYTRSIHLVHEMEAF